MRAGRWAVGLVVAGLVTGGCAQRGDPGDPRIAEIVAAAEADAAATAVDPPGTDATETDFNETTDPEDAFNDLQESELDCILDGTEAEGIDEAAAFSDPSAIDERVAYMDIVLGCVTQRDVLAEIVFGAAFRAHASFADISESEGVCVVEHVLDEAPEPARLVVSPTQADTDLFVAALEACLTAANFEIVTGVEGTGPQAYGDDDRLDSMQDDCEDGDMRACDLLYLASNEGSGYEDVALACGGSDQDTDTFCSPEPEVDDRGFAPDDSPGLKVLAEDCKDGDLTACDLLYQLAPFGHELENVGYTCGGELPMGAIPDCRTELG